MKILILASNPRNDLKLVHEIRDLKNVIETSRNRQHFEVEDALAVRVGDLQDLLLKNRPHGFEITLKPLPDKAYRECCKI